jgi:glycosyltransferase involved in cell wall biosynthesis
MFVSVLTCTRNRAESLRRLLTSFTRLIIPPAVTWEVLIIDNASTDATAAVIASFTNALPIRVVVESTAGVSSARNRGVASAGGDYIIWTDDDCEADENWLAAYVAAFQTHPVAALFAGRIVPVLAPPATPGFAQNLDLLAWLVAARDFGPASLPLSVPEDRLPFGANAAIRAADQRRFLYDVSLGVKHHARMVGEEMAVYRAMLDAGAQGWWVPGAVISHHITAERQTIAYVRAYFAGHGEFGVQRDLLAGTASLSGVLGHHLPRLFAHALLCRLPRLLPRRLWLGRIINWGVHEGAVRYALERLRRS